MICPKCKHDFIPDNRTSQQNKYLHAILGEIAEDTGHSLNEVKQIMKYRCGLLHETRYGVIIYDSTAGMTKEQLADFIDKIVIFASEKLGMVILSPEEYFSNSNENSK
jgi:hypothetical protein